MKKEFAKSLKNILDVVIKSERNERYTGIMYQPQKPNKLKRDDKKKSN